MNRASHVCGFWFISLTFCMQRRRVPYNRNVTRQKKEVRPVRKQASLLLSSSVMSLLFCLAVAAFILLSTGSLRRPQLNIRASSRGGLRSGMFRLHTEIEWTKRTWLFIPLLEKNCHHLKKQEASWIGKTYFLLVSAFGKNIHSKDKTSQFIKWLLHLLKTVIFF